MIKRNPLKKKRKNQMRKMGSSILSSKMVIPGMDLFPKIVAGNTPTKDGVYLVYHDYSPPTAWSNTKKVAGQAVVTFSEGKWGFNQKIYAYMGPLPILALPALLDCQPPYLINQIFYVATLEQAALSLFEYGPFPQFISAFLQRGQKGQFVFCMDSDQLHPYPIAKFSTKKKKTGNFLKLSKKAIVKYTKRLDAMRESS